MGVGAVYLASLGVFAYAARGADHFAGELTVTLWLQSWSAPWLDTLMTAISAPGFRNIALPTIGLTTAFLFIRGERRASLMIWVAVVVTAVSNYTVTRIVARPRPDGDLVQTFRDLDGFSFPSGHVMYYVVFLGTLAFITTQKMQPGASRWLIRASLVLALAAVGVSRIYLGAHWLGDVVAGYALGGLVAAGAVAIRRKWLF